MFKEMWRSIVRWWRSLLSGSPSRSAVVAHDLPLLSDPDYEYLFMQLLEGVAHGWQQPRVLKFFYKVKQRAPKSQWVAWLQGFGYRLVNSTAPNEELARKMIQLSELDCGEVTTLAGEFGHQLLGRIYGEVDLTEEYLPELAANGLLDLEFADLDIEDTAESPAVVEIPLPPLDDVFFERSGELQSPPPPPMAKPFQEEPDHDRFFVELETLSPEPLAVSDSKIDLDATYAQVDALDIPRFGEVPPELRIATKSAFAAIFSPPVVLTPEPEVIAPPALEEYQVENSEIEEPEIEEQVLSLDEFAVMLQNDPDLVQEIAQQLGIEATDPQVVLDAVITQMQQQIQDGN
jgi:hypothetical protein